MNIGDLIRREDWKKEKHVPVIELPETIGANEPFRAKVSLGKEIEHPNTVEHHIRWIRLYFKPEDENIVYEVGSFEFSAHGESAGGANDGPVHTHHGVTCTLTCSTSGHLIAMAYCNIHGLWENSAPLTVS